MKYFEFNAEELRDIIFGRTQFRKCPACDNNGFEYYDWNGEGVCASPRPEWGDNYEKAPCEECDGLGFTPHFFHEMTLSIVKKLEVFVVYSIVNKTI